MADERRRPPDSVEAPGDAGTEPEPEPSRPAAAPPAGRPGGLASPRSATVKLPDAIRDPSCVRAHAEGAAGPQAEKAPTRSGFTPVRTTQKLGTVPVWTAAGARGAAGAAGKEARAASHEAAPEQDEPPPRSVRRSRPWAEVPDPTGAGVRVIAELEAASRDLDSVPMEPIQRLNARGRSPDSLRSPLSRRGRQRSAQTDPDDSAPHGREKMRLDSESDPDFGSGRSARRSARQSSNRAATSAGYVGAILVLIGAGLWIWNAAAAPREKPTAATTTPAATIAPRVEATTSTDTRPTATTTAAPATPPTSAPSADPTVAPTSPPPPQTPPSTGPQKGRLPQQKQPWNPRPEIVDPWDKPTGR